MTTCRLVFTLYPLRVRLEHVELFQKMDLKESHMLCIASAFTTIIS